MTPRYKCPTCGRPQHPGETCLPGMNLQQKAILGHALLVLIETGNLATAARMRDILDAEELADKLRTER